MNNWIKALVSSLVSIKEVIKIIDESSLQIALVVDNNNYLLGTVTDGDIRRGILNGISLEESVKIIMNPNPKVARVGDNEKKILEIMKNTRLHHIPIVDENGYLEGIKILDELIRIPNLIPTHDNWVVLMAGGIGSRLRPLTEDIPKPLLKVGNKPILETIIESFISQGFHRFYLSVNYKATMIMDYFGDGSRWDIEIRYIRESQKLGTAGALSLIPEKPIKPIIVMNGDLLTKVNFQLLLDFHIENQSQATMCVREYNYQIPYGVVKIDRNKLIGIEEKPIQKSFVSAGIYVLNPSVLELIPNNTYFDMPSLFENLISQRHITFVFPIREYWLDIGRYDDYEKANLEYEEMFK